MQAIFILQNGRFEPFVNLQSLPALRCRAGHRQAMGDATLSDAWRSCNYGHCAASNVTVPCQHQTLRRFVILTLTWRVKAEQLSFFRAATQYLIEIASGVMHESAGIN